MDPHALPVVRPRKGQAFALIEAKVVASLLLREFDWTVEDDAANLVWVPTLHPRDGTRDEVHRRRDAAAPVVA